MSRQRRPEFLSRARDTVLPASISSVIAPSAYTSLRASTIRLQAPAQPRISRRS